MIDPAQILALPEKEWDEEVWKLLYPVQWKSVSAHIKLDWNLAMKMRDDVCKENPIWFVDALDIRIRSAQNPNNYDFETWLACQAQPHHYILAALMAKENK